MIERGEFVELVLISSFKHYIASIPLIRFVIAFVEIDSLGKLNK